MDRDHLRQERLQKLSQETRDWFDRMRQESREMSNHPKLFSVTSAQLDEERTRFFEEARQRFHSRMSSTSQTDELFNQFVRENQERFSQMIQQQQSAFSRGTIVSNRSQSQNHDEVSPGKEKEAEGRGSREASANVSSISVPKTNQYRHRALSRDGGRDLYASRTDPSHQPTAAEVVASLLSERGYTPRIPLRQRLIVARSNNLNNNNNHNNNINVNHASTSLRTALKKDSNNPRVHTITVIREPDQSHRTGEKNPNEETSGATPTDKTESENPVNNKSNSDLPSKGEGIRRAEPLKRSNSGLGGLSASLSGFSSLGADDIVSSPVQSRLRQLLDKRNSCEHHPSFSNHFVGFGKFSSSYLNSQATENLNNFDIDKLSPFSNFPSFKHRSTTTEGGTVLPSTPILPSKSSSSNFSKCSKIGNLNGRKLTESKSASLAMTSGKDRTSFGQSEEAASSSYGDSETESDEDDDDDDVDLDSVSVVDDRQSNISNATSQQAINNSGDADSGRGNSPSCSSPASSSSSTVVSSSEISANISNQSLKSGARIATRNNATASGKPARPISAVPSELSDISYTTSDDAGIEDEHEDIPTSDIQVDILKEPAPDTGRSVAEAHRIACELLSTEEQYVSVLSLIDQKFYFRVDQENRVSKMFPQETLVQMFANIKSIYQFHAEFVLPPLRERMSKWPEDPKYQKIGDIMVSLAHFFKMYTEYVKSFENARNTINLHYQKNSKFAAIMDEIHALPECGNLTLQQHMLTPIQRIPRYVLLLKKYLSKLPEDSPDRADSEQTLQLVSAAASHAEDAMKRTEKFKKVLEVQESLGGTIDLVSPTRELVKEGKIVKISARSGDHQDRYLFLFSDLLLLCSFRLIGNRVINRPTYRLRARFEVDSIQVQEGNNLVTANTFFIRDDHKSVELYTHTRAEKEEWVSSLFHAIKELFNKKSSLKIGENQSGEVMRSSEMENGRIKQRLLKVDSIQKCMDCGQSFTLMKKKYNCTACGMVACNKCSSRKFSVTSTESKPSRVCRACYAILRLQSGKASLNSEVEGKDENNQSGSTARAITDPSTRPRGLLEVSASAPSLVSGYLMVRASQVRPNGAPSPGGLQSSSTSTSRVTSKAIKRWFSLHSDFVMYTFQRENDTHALTATPMPGYTLLTGPELKGDAVVSDKDRAKTIKMFYTPFQLSSPRAPECSKAYYFTCSSADEAKRWVEALKLASKAEVPSPEK